MKPAKQKCKWHYRGYCEMSRFFAGYLHDIPELSDFEYVWRIHTGGFILAPGKRDLLAVASCNKCGYGIGAMSVEPSAVVFGLWQSVNPSAKDSLLGINPGVEQGS